MIPSAVSAEIVASAGYEWVCVDTQHGLIGRETMVMMVQALHDRVATLIRVGWNEPHLIMQALDSGADGVIVPMVNTGEEATAAVQACHYPPRGIRKLRADSQPARPAGPHPRAGGRKGVLRGDDRNRSGP